MRIVDLIVAKLAVCETDKGMIELPIKFIRGKVRDKAALVEKDGFYYVDEDVKEARTDEEDQ